MIQSFDIKQQRLDEVVKKMKKDNTYQIHDFSFKKMKDGTVGEVYRVYGIGHGELDKAIENWSIIIKIVQRWQRYGDPESWDREAKLYKSYMFNNLPKGMTVPECYAVDRISDNKIHIWMEYVEGKNGENLKQYDYGIPAYHLGLFHGSIKNIPEYTFLSCRHLPIIYAGMWGTRSIDWLNKKESNGVVEKKLKEEILGMWAKRDMFMDLLRSLPATVSHRDFHYENVFVKKDAKGNNLTTMIDWDTTGIGVLGEDIADFTVEALMHKQVPLDDADKIRSKIMDSYINGLLEAGWDKDVRIVRLGYAITVCLHWTFRALYMLSQANNVKDRMHYIRILKFCIAQGNTVIGI